VEKVVKVDSGCAEVMAEIVARVNEEVILAEGAVNE
jgi:hypothetical protein